LFFFGIQLVSNAQATKEVVIPGLYGMPQQNVQKQATAVVKNAAVREDLHRFMGYEVLPTRYLSLPYDVFIKTNVDAFFIDVGFILLLLFPVFFLFRTKNISIQQSLLLNVSFWLLGALLLIISIPSAFLNQQNIASPAEAITFIDANPRVGLLGGLSDSINSVALSLYTPLHNWFASFSGTQDGVTYPILIVLFLALIFLVKIRLQAHSTITKTMVFFMTIYACLWWVLGSGAAWYGILLFSVSYIFLIKGMELGAESKSDVWGWKDAPRLAGKSGILLIFSVIWLFMAFTHRAANYSPVSEERAKHIYIPPFIEYQAGNMGERQLLDYHFPMVSEFKTIVNKNDNGLIYRVGTNLNYFIKKNDQRVINDTFLDLFAQMVQRFKNKRKIIEALKMSGFEYIVIDLALANNDVTPDKTLTRKFTNLLNTLYNNPAVEVALTDRTIKMNDTGETINAVFQDKGTIVFAGQIAVFRIK